MALARMSLSVTSGSRFVRLAINLAKAEPTGGKSAFCQKLLVKLQPPYSHRQGIVVMNRLLRFAVGTALFVPVVALVAQATEPNPKQLQKARHDHYHELGDAFKVVRDQTRASTPDMAAIKTAAKHVNDASINQEKW